MRKKATRAPPQMDLVVTWEPRFFGAAGMDVRVAQHLVPMLVDAARSFAETHGLTLALADTTIRLVQSRRGAK